MLRFVPECFEKKKRSELAYNINRHDKLIEIKIIKNSNFLYVGHISNISDVIEI